MARNLNALAPLLLLAVAATLFHGSDAQTRHVVGGSAGWTIPTSGASFYSNWAANNTFRVGDTLVFNFTNGQHNVAKVTKSAYDACSTGNTLMTWTSSPATVTLNETGEQYFICAFPGHCAAGQKLAVNVGGKGKASSPAPQPSSSGGSGAPKVSPVSAPPAQAPAPAPGPGIGPVTYTVGGSMGWTVPANGSSAYTRWASSKSFKVGDILVFNYPKNAHNVEEVTKDKFDSCSSTSPLATYTTPPVRLTLNKSGDHYFICGIPGHCSAGQKLSVKVSGTSTATPPSGSPSPSTSPSPSSPATNPSSLSPSSGSASPPPQNSAAVSLGPVAFSATVLSVAAAAAAFFY